MTALRTASAALAVLLASALSAGPALAAPAATPAGPSAPKAAGAGTKADGAKADGAKADGAVIVRGAPLAGAPAVALPALLKAPEAHQGKTVRLEGPVRAACDRKGCWMELAAEQKAPGVRVTFKDYGFFVPLDSAGARARVEGVVEVKELSEKDAEHYRSEGATVPVGADGKPREVRLVATGVELRR
jgi:hypothetical protein